ncbi:MAG: hypothetical protein JJT94_09255 [Bernardetiaceae bacterium]|nr:hypothetical protein [Bernardetiaceae bacterium]
MKLSTVFLLIVLSFACAACAMFGSYYDRHDVLYKDMPSKLKTDCQTAKDTAYFHLATDKATWQNEFISESVPNFEKSNIISWIHCGRYQPQFVTEKVIYTNKELFWFVKTQAQYEAKPTTRSQSIAIPILEDCKNIVFIENGKTVGSIVLLAEPDTEAPAVIKK